MKMLVLLIAISLVTCSCQKADKQPVYKASNYSIYKNKVVQGEYTAQVHSSSHISSDYQSPANATFPNFIEFKFAINGKDNELPIGVNHTFLLQTNEQGKIELPLLTFGQKHKTEVYTNATGSIAPNTEVTIRVDASDVINSFDEKGYFEANNGQKIYQEDYNGIYIAGNLAPLGWDFDNLNGRADRQLMDNNNDGIFEITLSLNPYNPDDFTAKEWKLQHDLSKYPQLQTDIPLIDALYNLALDETEINIENDGTFRTGEEWPGVWTRDVSYSILLAYAYTNPDIAKTSLMRKVKNDRIIQDTGTGGAWPVSSDRTTWALAAWEVYKVTGDQEWLETIYPIIKNSVEDDLQTLFDNQSNLVKGESSFLDWRKQTYPVWMNGVDIFDSRCLGTNAVHAQAYYLLSEMATLLGEDAQKYQALANRTKLAINNELWMEEKGYYAQYLYGRHGLMSSPRSEALGEAFTILFNIADNNQAQSIISNTPVVDYGIPCIYPQIPGIPPYHNNGIWPFVQAYWNWACAKAKNTSALEQGLAAMNRSAALFLTNKENMVAENGDFRDTEVNSNRQLWSVAGYLSSVYRIFAGMNFETDGLRFQPYIPKNYGQYFKLSNIKYREAQINLTIKGYGTEIKSCLINGKPSEAFIIADDKGQFDIHIELSEEPSEIQAKMAVDNSFSLATPLVKANRNKLNWDEVKDATAYQIIKNGQVIETTTDTEYIATPEAYYTEYCIKAINDAAYSFASEPIAFIPATSQTIQAEQDKQKRTINAKGYNGGGYLELSQSNNRYIKYQFTIDKPGNYIIQARYSNGSGPDNTDNKCAIRTLSVNNTKAGVWVMPQRGKDEWSNWGVTNLVHAALKKGSNTIEISFEDYNNNMNVDINTALLDEIRIIPTEN